MVNPMQPVLGHIIQPTQSAFVLHREIHDNILLAHEVIMKFNSMKGKKSWAALKLDMGKLIIELNGTSCLTTSQG